jgi:hypothetical protein
MAISQLEIDTSQILNLERLFQQAGPKAPIAIRRAINRTGVSAAVNVEKALVVQTGLKRGVIHRAVKRKPGAAGQLSFVLKSRGGNVSLKYFKARETRKGVSAAPWGHRHIFAGTFIKGGKFPNRVALNMGGQVFKRAGRGRKPIIKQKSGLFIPNEMITGASATAFLSAVRTVLPARLQHEIAAILGGVAPS